MTEDEYLKATNRVKISAALNILRDVLGGYGISNLELLAICKLLAEAETKLFSSYKLEEPE